MEPDFWQQRWQEGRIGFHQDRETPLMLKHWPSLQVPAGSRVFVPLAGKTLDMLWFADQGYRVLGIELATTAIQQFLAEHGLQAEITDAPDARHYRAGDIELINGDVFEQDPAQLAGCDAVYDRAALIALPPALRQRYVREVYGRLPSGCRGLLITLEYPQSEKAGPPFSVEEDEVRALFSPQWEVGVLERREILAQQPNFSAEGVSALHTVVYELRRR
ncbi:thiopurine S-methyltransferase [Lysobacter sp. A03]|uniref:thiopurine S-methyltransferase n=1 Tax=Lysobacter sp. A03 TaxID=1199154 RepID=UPI0005B72B45|nr:thiopurine S-methyltransferase [Lysobacter sp. A03]KIQ96663.1 Thiopurine S-methyltransferase [Lysobacter sp. A03]